MQSRICSGPIRMNRLSNDTRMFFPEDALKITTISAVPTSPDGSVKRTREPMPCWFGVTPMPDPLFSSAVTTCCNFLRGAANGSRSIAARLRCAVSIDIRSIDPTSAAECNRSSIALEASAILDLNRFWSVSKSTAAKQVLHSLSEIEFICPQSHPQLVQL
jgi:hypothetical protein